MINKKTLVLLIVFLGVMIALPIGALSHAPFYGVICGITTMIMLDMTMLRSYPAKLKIGVIVIYTLSMIAVIAWLFML